MNSEKTFIQLKNEVQGLRIKYKTLTNDTERKEALKKIEKIVRIVQKRIEQHVKERAFEHVNMDELFDWIHEQLDFLLDGNIKLK